jgi:hypothetical protein
VANSTNLYTVVSPEQVLSNCTIVHHDYRRDVHRGVTMIHVDVWLQQVRLTEPMTFSQSEPNASKEVYGPTQPSGASPASGGTVQAQTPAPSTVATFETIDV